MWCDLATDGFKFMIEDANISPDTKSNYEKKIQQLNGEIQGMRKIVSKRDLEINALRKGNATLQKKLLNKD